MAGRLDRLGRFAARHRWHVIGAWVLVTAVVGGAAVAAGGTPQDGFSIPGAQSRQATNLLTERFPSESGDVALVVVPARRESRVASSAPVLQGAPAADA